MLVSPPLNQSQMNVLVTGGAGFIGSSLIPYLLRQSAQDQDLEIEHLVNYDKLTQAGHTENLADSEIDARYRFVQGDVSDRPLLAKTLALHEIDALIHLAAESPAGGTLQNPDAWVATNLVGTYQVLEACRAHKQATGKELRLLHLSTADVYGSIDSSSAPPTEASPLAPNNPYAATKAGGNHLVTAYAKTYGLAAITVTTSCSFGPFQSPDHLIPKAIRRIALGHPVALFGDGSRIRDWTYVEDLCRGLTMALLRGQPGEVYHVSAQNERKDVEVVRQLISVVHALQPGHVPPSTDELIEFLPQRYVYNQRCALDSTKIHQDLGWSPLDTFEAALRKTVQWYLDNEDWTESIEARLRTRQPLKLPPSSSE
jgi:dTDP-glucose 4,6-dehydratase